jgi:surfeit locus 1 family protein
MMRLPLFPTVIVMSVIAIMVRLGFWQLDRRIEKQALIATYMRNTTAPEMAMLPRAGKQFLYRRARLQSPNCGGAEIFGAGKTGYRVVTFCKGIGKVQLGTTRDPRAIVKWSGGNVSGWIQSEPDNRSVLEVATGGAEPLLMLVADPPLAGLAPNPPVSPEDVANNHLAYAVQWFLFAAVAASIFGLALRRRNAAG